MVEGEVKKGEYWRGHALLDDAHSEYELVLTSAKADCDLFVVRRERTSVAPDATSYDWRGVEAGDDRLVLSHEDSRFSPGEFDIAVQAYDGDARFSLQIHRKAKTAPSPSSPSPSASTDTTLCDNCHKPIPVRSMAMHSLQCSRINSPCPHCSLVLLTRHLPKHVAMVHTPVPCPACGQRVELPLMGAHRRETCVGRLVECQYCPLLLTASERGEHSAEDGLFRSACKECGEVVQRKLMRRHLRLQHGGNEKDVTWEAFF